MNEKFFQNRQALIVVIAASLVVLVSMGIRQTWGLFYGFFENDLGFSREQFGLAIGIQMFFWGSLAPVFGIFADKYGANRVVIFAFILYILGVYWLIAEPKSVFGFQMSLGVLVGFALGGTAMSVQVSTVGKFFSNKKNEGMNIKYNNAGILLPEKKIGNKKIKKSIRIKKFIFFLVLNLDAR